MSVYFSHFLEILDLLVQQTAASFQQASEWTDYAFLAAFLLLWFGLPIYFLIKARNRDKLRQLMRELPTSKVRGVFVGMVELKGELTNEPPLCAPFSEENCVWYRSRIEEKWQRYEEETVTDSKGNVHVRRRLRSGWVTIAEDESNAPFLLSDESGSLRIWPQGATMDAPMLFSRRCSPMDELYYSKGPAEAIADSAFVRRFTEHGFPAGCKVYLLGCAREREDMAAPEIAASPHKEDSFFISHRDEKMLRRILGLKAISFPLLAYGCLMAGCLLCYLSTAENPPQRPFLHFALVGLPIFAILPLLDSGWRFYLRLVRLRQRLNNAKSLLDVQYQRRHELIPRLQKVVSSYCRHENDIQSILAELRRGNEGDNDRLILRTEAYPELKANPLFQEFSSRLRDTENRICMAREYYNELCGFYNSSVTCFPNILLARLLGMRPQAFEQAETRAQAVPTV